MAPVRKKLPHEVPSWVPESSIYFITINTQPRGQNQLANDDLAQWLWQSIEFRESKGEWYVYLMLLMPDHLHALMSFPRTVSLSKSISQWKRYTARDRGIVWQRDYFEHRLRSDENHMEKAHYIRMNPVRKGLCATPDDWPYVWSKGYG